MNAASEIWLGAEGETHYVENTESIAIEVQGLNRLRLLKGRRAPNAAASSARGQERTRRISAS